jgi:hypothetical protein
MNCTRNHTRNRRQVPRLAWDWDGASDACDLAMSMSDQISRDAEARLSRLEDEFRTMSAELSATRVVGYSICAELERLPSTWQMVAITVAGNAALAAILVAMVRLFGSH